MKYGILTLDDVQVTGKTVLLRLDINEPVDRKTNTLKDVTRIQACIPTIKELAQRGAKVVILAHQGSDIEYNNFYTTKPHAIVLSEALGQNVEFIDDVCGPAARIAIKALKAGGILLLDNVRFVSEEQTLFELNLKLSHEKQTDTLLIRKLAPLADIYVCDAFAAAHRDQPSLCAFEYVLPSAMGRLFEKEYCILSDMMENPKRPCIFILGGAKIADAFSMISTVLKKGVADYVLTGGLAGQILLWSKGISLGDASKNVIRERGYQKYVAAATDMISEFSDRVILPDDMAYVKNNIRFDVDIDNLPNEEILTDIGRKTAEKYQRLIYKSETVFVNGPMGVFENTLSEYGTKAVWMALKNTGGFTVIGGGDSIAAANKYNVKSSINYVCTGGGALIRFLSGEELPVVRALRYSSKKTRQEDSHED